MCSLMAVFVYFWHNNGKKINLMELLMHMIQGNCFPETPTKKITWLFGFFRKGCSLFLNGWCHIFVFYQCVHHDFHQNTIQLSFLIRVIDKISVSTVEVAVLKNLIKIYENKYHLLSLQNLGNVWLYRKTWYIWTDDISLNQAAS